MTSVLLKKDKRLNISCANYIKINFRKQMGTAGLENPGTLRKIIETK
jgi:hypothetical protein